LRSETNRLTQVEETIEGSGRFYKLFDFYSISRFQKFRENSRNSFLIFNEHKQDFDDLGCDEQTFKYHSDVDEPCPAADSEIKPKQLKGVWDITLMNLVGFKSHYFFGSNINEQK
jgi:hypothetical protein